MFKQEIENLLEYFKNYQKLAICNEFEYNSKRKIKDLCNSSILRNSCTKTVNDIFTGKSIKTLNEDIAENKELYSNCVYLIKNRAIFDNISNYYNTLDVNLAYYYKLLEKYNNKFFKIFTSKKEKQNIGKGVNFLTNLKEGHFQEKINEYYDVLSSYDFTESEILEFLKENFSRINDLIRALVLFESSDPALYYIQEDIKSAKKILDKQITIKSLNDEIVNYQTAIREHAKKIITINKYEQIEKMPIEEINNGNGIKAGLLRTNGFKTIADVWRAPESAISNIKGISAPNAYFIKKRANEIFNSLEDEKINFRIDYDNQDEKQTGLLKLIYNYGLLLNLKNVFSDKDIDFYLLNSSVNIFNYLKNSMEILFFDDFYRAKLLDSYERIKSFLSSNYCLYCDNFLKLSIENVKYLDSKFVWQDFKENNISYYNCIEKLMPEILKNDNNYGLTDELSKLIENECFYPEGLTCELRSYQEYGVKYILHQKRVLLGDEMGLGKTIQSIAAMVSLRNVGFKHFIVICPASVIENWFREIRDKSKLQSYKAHGTQRNKIFASWEKEGGVLITTYETFQKFTITNLNEIGLITVDEAHFVKNPKTKRSKSVYKICNETERVLFMSGTPLENNVDEMLQLISVLNYKTYYEARAYANIVQSKKFREIVQEVYFRRKQEQVLNELPEKIETMIWVKMTKVETEKYEELLLTQSHTFMPSRQISFEFNDSGKIAALKDIVEEVIKENRKIVIFSFFKTSINKVREIFDEISVPVIDGSVNPEQRQEILDEFSKNDSKYILPAQIQAGGVGLNMQMASVVILLEPQVKPSIENQAIARVHRMGQAQKTLIYKLCNEENIDEVLIERLKEKQEQFDAFADKSVAGLKSLELDEKEISNMINQEIERIKSKRANSKIEINPGFDIKNAVTYEPPDWREEVHYSQKFYNSSLDDADIDEQALILSKRSAELKKDGIIMTCDLAWVRFHKNDAEIESDEHGKWMHFFGLDLGAKRTDEIWYIICSEAIKNGICRSVKYSNCYNIKDSGVICFYTDLDNIEEHKKIIKFFFEKHLLKRTSGGNYPNISFKLDSQTGNNEYGKDFMAKLRLSDLVDLKTGRFLDEEVNDDYADDLI